MSEAVLVYPSRRLPRTSIAKLGERLDRELAHGRKVGPQAQPRQVCTFGGTALDLARPTPAVSVVHLTTIVTIPDGTYRLRLFLRADNVPMLGIGCREYTFPEWLDGAGGRDAMRVHSHPTHADGVEREMDRMRIGIMAIMGYAKDLWPRADWKAER